MRIKRSNFDALIEEGYDPGTPAQSASPGYTGEDFWNGDPPPDPTPDTGDEPA